METYIVDSFTKEAFKGNPAGVCLPERSLPEEKMLAIAQEFNLSETAFIQYSGKDKQYTIRYFSPKMEIPLCGHATLAAAKVVFEKLGVESLNFLTGEGLVLNVKKLGGQILMEFPIYETTPAEAPNALLEALGISKNKVVNVVYNKETNILVLEITDSKKLVNLKPDFEALVGSIKTINGVLITAPSLGDGFDFHSRYFWPWSGSNEDPVTGATHTFLAKYWGDKLGKKKLRSFQSSMRTGSMEIDLLDDKKLVVHCDAVIVFKGQLLV